MSEQIVETEVTKDLYDVIAIDKLYELELTENEANFLNSKGPVFVGLWARRLKKGMKSGIRAEFDKMVEEFVWQENEVKRQLESLNK